MNKHTIHLKKSQSKLTDSRYFIKQLLLLIITGMLVQYGKAQFNCTGFSVSNLSYSGVPQTFTVPSGVTEVRIQITGASGGVASTSTNNAGGGAIVYANINVVPGDIFRVIIGQKGANGIFEAGGGGSSAVYKNGTLIMVAGAGSGEDNTGDGGNGLAAINGGSSPADDAGACGASPNNGRGGTSGSGGNHGEFASNCPQGGGGGGGLNSAGQGNGNTNAGQPGGQGNINGAAGGIGSADDAPATFGGWGWSGGGGADDRESGGGGGYSGGGGGPESRNPGGGGSFVAAIGTNGITASGKTDGTGTTTGSNGSATICSSVLIVLPVTFESFTVEPVAAGTLIKWVVSAEINTAWYEVEKSTDGVNFTSLRTLPATGINGGTQSYNFTDSSLNAGKTFYRIRATDRDSRSSYSAIRFINGQQNGLALTVYPNPVTDKISIILPQSWQGVTSRIQVINATGQLVLDKRGTLLQNDLNVSMLAPGTYLVQVTSDRSGVQLNAKFIK
jgi:hypothetical protein